MSFVASNIILAATATTLLWIGATDLREYKIRNEFIVVLVGLFFVYAYFSGRWSELPWHIAIASITFLLMIWSYAQGQMGGGDLKLITVALLWTGPRCAVLFLIVMVLSALAHTLLAWLGWVGAQRKDGHIRIPFAPSIAVGLISVILSGCLN
jgi:prepilin peptidase CpaA